MLPAGTSRDVSQQPLLQTPLQTGTASYSRAACITRGSGRRHERERSVECVTDVRHHNDFTPLTESLLIPEKISDTSLECVTADKRGCPQQRMAMVAPMSWLSLGGQWGPETSVFAAVRQVVGVILALPLLNFLLLGVVAYVTVRFQKRRSQVLLASQKARWDGLAQAATGFTVSESMTLGWLNVLLRHVWPTLLEKEIAEAVTKQIEVGSTPVTA